MKSSRCIFVFMRAPKATIRFRNGRRKSRLTRPSHTPGFIAIRNINWRSAFLLEKFRFPEPIGAANVVLAAQDEVATLPHYIPMKDLDVKIGGNEFDRLRRWHKLGILSKSRGIPRQRFPETSSPRKIAALIRQGVLQNARFAASVIVIALKHSSKEDQRLSIRSALMFSTPYQIPRH